jgi:hypothetical protein
MRLLIIVLAIVLFLVFIPVWPYSRSWGYGPGGVAALLLVVVLFFVLFGSW